jgi:uncharacterized protein YhaN
MSISIDKMSVRNLGPIRTFSHDMGKINLIYGHNERGKTMLVEFLIRSLFKPSKTWPLREMMGEGSVTVSGLEDEAIPFKPGSAKKLEDHWESKRGEIPQDISKLLVVRAADTALSDEHACGIGKQILLEYLSGKGVIDSIQGKIAGVLKKATFEEGMIVGGIESGIKKSLSEKEAQIAQYTEAVDRYNAQFSQGRSRELKENARIFSERFEAMVKAKRYAAFVCHQEIEHITQELSDYPADTLDAIQEAITKLTTKKQDAERTAGDLAEAKKASAHYAWVEEAIDLYEKRERLALPKYHYAWLALAGLCLAAFLTLSLGFGYPIRDYGMIALLIGMAGGVSAFIYTLLKLLKNKHTLDDIADIQQGYQKKFGSPLSGLVELQAVLKEMSEPYHSIKTLNGALDRTKNEIAGINTDLINFFLSTARGKVSTADFESKYAKIKDKKKRLENALGKAETELAVLDVDPAEYTEDAAAVAYDKKSYEETRQVLESVREEIAEEEAGLLHLKQGLCTLTGNDIDEKWDVILDVLLTKQTALIEEYKQLKADIIAQILVNQSLDAYREKEDEKIRAGLQSEVLVEALIAITGRYTRIDLAGDALVVSDGFGEYPFSDLSTGTQEQIFLALRIAFAARVSKNENLFFILDDAFQYSDWERRELLVDKMIDLAKHDWQVIYFSMDDHIRDLFVKKAGKAFKDGFRLIEIDTES